MLSAAIPWTFQSSWTASSLNECREQIAAAYGAEHHGACWSVIRERFNQLIYGPYPLDQQWRLNLAFVLLCVALAPILFTSLPRKMLWFSAVYPVLAVWLIWGGTAWSAIMFLVAVLAAWAVFTMASHYIGAALGIVAAVIGFFFWLWVSTGTFEGFDATRTDPKNISSFINSFLPIELERMNSKEHFGGFALSIIIGVTGIVCSFPLGILLALGRRSNLFFIKTICVGFIEFIRGVPLITLLFVASTMLNFFLPPGTNFDIILRVIIMVTLFASAYMAEVIRGGLAALPKGQYEAADALGLDYWQAQRLIIMPQALKISIPAIVSTFIGLFKDTTLVSIIGLFDPLGLAKFAIPGDAEWQGIFWELYIFVAVIFFIFCFGMSRYSMYLENKLKTDRR